MSRNGWIVASIFLAWLIGTLHGVSWSTEIDAPLPSSRPT